jgi:hypothetical protein
MTQCGLSTKVPLTAKTECANRSILCRTIPTQKNFLGGDLTDPANGFEISGTLFKARLVHTGTRFQTGEISQTTPDGTFALAGTGRATFLALIATLQITFVN